MAARQSSVGVDRRITAQEQLTRFSNRRGSTSSLSSADETDGGRTKLSTRSPVTKDAAGGSGSNSSPEDADDEPEDGDDDEDDASDDEPDEIAPSGASKRRGHQTGLSLSLSHTSLGKRGRSPGMEEQVERPMSKMSKTSATADSSDDDYNAVDDISESEEEDDVEKLEEKMIIESEEDEVSDRPRRGSQSSLDSFFGLGGDGIEESFAPGNQHFLNELFSEAHSAVHDNQDEGAPVTRRVRFADDVQLHSSSSTTETDEDEDEETIYPDLFLQQDSLDPTFRKLIEQKDYDDRSSDGESYWDFGNDQDVQELDDGSDTETESSGYETDEGETTDEEIIPPRTVSKPLTSLRQGARSSNRLRGTATPASTPIRKGTAGLTRRGPLMGSFLVDDDKPIAVVDGHGKHMLFFPAPKHRRQAAQGGGIVNSSPGPAALAAYHTLSETESDIGFSQTDPMLSSPANAMLPNFGNARNRPASALSSEITGPPEAFFPFTSISSTGIVETDQVEDDTFDEFSDEEDNLRIEDFINFGDEDSSSEDDRQEQSENTDSNNTATEEKDVEKTPQPKRAKIPGFKARTQSTPTPVNTGSLLEHFDKGVVSSFRRNNDRHKMLTRNSSNTGIKGSRLHAADTLISPLRRRRGGSVSMGPGRSPLRPQENVSNMASPQPSPHHQFGGPLKKRIQNSNHIRRSRKGTI